MGKKQRIKKIIEIFDVLYPDAKCSLDYTNALQLLVSAQLAAQCTDKRVNIVTKDLYGKYKNANDFANADLQELEQEIKSTGFYHNKAYNIIQCCKKIVDDFNGEVPNTLEDLLKLAGVGRKTANLILGDVYDTPAIVVDTHAKRLSKRMGLTANEDPEKIEYDLMELVPQKDWSRFCHQMVCHGRVICTARSPKCPDCEIREYCDQAKAYEKKQESIYF